MDWNGRPQVIWANPIQSGNRSFAFHDDCDTVSIRGLVSFSPGPAQNCPLPSDHRSFCSRISIISTPKTANAIRTIAISQELADHIRVYLQTWRPNKDNLLFISPNGGPLHPCSVRRDSLGPICDSLGIKVKGMKAFRHCSATLMDQAGVPMKVRQERLGHAPGTKVTMVHYTHTLTKDSISAANTVGKMLVN